MPSVGLPGFAVHPGEILVEEFMKPMKLTQQRLADRLGVSFRRVNEICRGRRSVTAETALLFAKVFRTSPQLWMNLQATYDLVTAQAGTKEALKHVRPLVKSAS